MRKEPPVTYVMQRALRARRISRLGQQAEFLRPTDSVAQAQTPVPSHSGPPAAAAAYILASVLGAFFCVATLMMGHGTEIALTAYALPCAVVMSLHFVLAAARMSGLQRPRPQAYRDAR